VSLKRKGVELFTRKRSLTNKDEKNTIESITTSQEPKNKDFFFGKVAYCLVGKNNCKC